MKSLIKSYFILVLKMVFQVFILILLTPAISFSNPKAVQVNRGKNVNVSDFEGLGPALKEFLEALPQTERIKVPQEYQNELLWYVEGTDNLPRSVAGWYIKASGSTLELTRWHIISDYRRVAAKIIAERSGNKWNFHGLSFIDAKTHPAK